MLNVSIVHVILLTLHICKTDGRISTIWMWRVRSHNRWKVCNKFCLLKDESTNVITCPICELYISMIFNVYIRWFSLLKYVGTDEAVLLEYALLELQKVLSAENANQKEEHYMASLACSRECNGSEIKLCLVQAIFFSISSWCDSKLQDYHLHFSQVNLCS